VNGPSELGVPTVGHTFGGIARVLPFQVLLAAGDSGLSADSKARAEQVRAVTTDRLRSRIGELPGETMKHLDDALRLHLAL
jgi:mRNA interferase MazF